MNPITFEYMERFYDELEPLEFYRKLFGVGVLADRDDYGTDEYGSFALHGTMVYPNQGKHGRKEKVWDDLAEIERAQGSEFAIMAPVAYLGWHRVNRNARYLFALAVDLDYIADSGMSALFQYIGAGRIPRPTFVVCSGNGLHLYFQYVEPIPCYEAAQRRLREYKNALTRLIWNSYITKHWKNPEIESIFQCMRVPGSQTKDGGVVRVFETGDPVTVEYMDGFLQGRFEKSRVGNLEIRTAKTPLLVAKVKYPEWYQRRVVEGRARGTWTANRKLYDWWLEKIKHESVVNHRYYAVLCLVIYAAKCGVPFDELKEDAYSLIPILDELTVEETNHFTADDVESALRSYGRELCRFPRKIMEELSAIPIPEAKRNGRKRAEHLELARAAQEIKQRKTGKKWNGRKSKYDVVQAWKREHPFGTKAECIRDTGLAKMTVYKHWAYYIEAHTHTGKDWTLEEIAKVLDIMVEPLKGLDESEIETLKNIAESTQQDT